MEQEISATKEREQKALKSEVAANLSLQRMKIDVEDAKVATDKVLYKSSSFQHTNPGHISRPPFLLIKMTLLLLVGGLCTRL
jgi:hypothetical protein